MTAEQICEEVADLVGLSYPDDKKKLFFLCRMANHEIWKQGKWTGMIKEFNVNTYTDQHGVRYMNTPTGYDVLLGVNVGSNPARINNHWFQFHKNGNGSVSKDKGWNHTDSVIDMGYFPTMYPLRRRHELVKNIPDAVYLAVRSRGNEHPDTKLTISGENTIGQLLYSFPAKANEVIETLESPRVENIQASVPTYGCEYKLTTKFFMYNNIAFSEVASITKTITANPVDVYAMHDTGESYLVATLEPHQTNAKFRRYMLPKELPCQSNCVHGMFKVSEPEAIVYPTQQMITDNITALIDMIMGMDLKYHKKDLNAAAVYVLSAVKALEDSTKENMANHQTSIQVDLGSLELPEIINVNY